MISTTSLISQGKKLDDWLSPILVKELRQGMRARAFVLSFLLIQVFLIMLVLFNLAANGDRNALDFQASFFWLIMGFTLLLLMPLRGLNAISLEVKNHTMETVMLTRLTAWRVVFGKWSALYAQSLLFVSAVLPFLVLRYFIGGDDVVSDFKILLLMLWASGLLIAGSIAVSAMGSVIVRVGLIVAGVMVVAIGGDVFPRFSTAVYSPGRVLAWLAIFGFFIPTLLFEFTASSIAPVSENHAIRRRLLALLFFVVSSGLEELTGNDFSPGYIIPIVVLVGVCYFDLAEKPRLFFRLVQPFVRLSWLGRITALFLLPGWPTALLFSLAVLPAAILLHAQMIPDNYRNYDGCDVWLLISAIFGSVLVPLIVCHLFWGKMKQVSLMIILYNIALLGASVLLQGFSTLTHVKVVQAIAFIPGLPVFSTSLQADVPIGFWPFCLIGNLLVVVVLIAILLGGSVRYFRELFALMRQAQAPGSSRLEGQVETP